MEAMGRDEERRIMSALQTSVGLVNDGVHPNDALAKVASEYQFGPSVVQRMVEAMNVSKTLAHMKTAMGPERASNFPLADASAILEKMYPTKIASVASKQALEFIPASLKKAETQNFMKVAAAKKPLPFTEKKSASYAQDAEIVATKLSGKYRGMQTKVAEAKREFRISLDKVLDLAKEAAEYFRLVDSVPFTEVEKRAYAEYGSIGLQTMNIIQLRGGLRVKRAAFKERPRLMFDSKQQPYGMIAKVAEAAEAMYKKAEEAVDCEIELSDFEKSAGLVEPKPKKLLDDIVSGGDDSSFNKAALDLGTVAAMGGMQALGLREPNPDSARRDALMSVIDPEHEAGLNSVKVKAMLNDFASNDPILSSYEPSEMSSAYNHIAQLAPNVSMQPMVMRGMLRKMLQQGGVMEPFEAHQLSEIEKRLMGLQAPPTLEASPKSM